MGQVLSHLSDSLDRLLVKASALKKEGDATDNALYGPYLGRATLEVSLLAITARFDPFRVLAIRKSQALPELDVGSRNPLAFSWSTDVQGEEKPKDWENKPTLRDLQRALMCKHFHDLFWEEAFTLVLDSVPMHKGGDWMTRLKKISPEGFTTAWRKEGDRLFSELSKGIHHEFVIPLVNQYDAVTVEDLLSRCWEFVAALGITSCYSPIAHPLMGVDAVACYEQAQLELIS